MRAAFSALLCVMVCCISANAPLANGQGSPLPPLVLEMKKVGKKLDNVTATIAKHYQEDETSVKYKYVMPCLEVIEKQFGRLPEYGSVDTDAWYTKFVAAYHYSFPAVASWPEARGDNARPSRDTLIHVRDVQAQVMNFMDKQDSLEGILNLTKNCKSSISKLDNWLQLSESEQDEVEKTIKEFNSSAAVAKLERGEWIYGDFKVLERRILIACRESFHTTLWAFISFSGGQTFNKEVIPEKAPPSPLRKMISDTMRYNKEIQNRIYGEGFQEYIDKVNKSGRIDEANELKERLIEIRDRLENTSYPYIDMLFKDESKAEEFWDGNDTGKFYNTIYGLLFEANFENPASDDSADFFLRWNFEDGIEQLKIDIDDGSFQEFVIKVEEFYGLYLNVSKMESRSSRLTTDKAGNKVVVGDGLWNWNFKTHWLENLRLAWDLLDGVLEEIKCYMKETYYFDLREQALQATQLNLTEGALFTGFSYTMRFPCQIVNDSDLVSPDCTVKNHEICAPVGPLESYQRTDSEFHEGKALLRPKWVFKYKKEAKRCWGRKDYIMQHYACRCGFRLDCGKHLGKNITCQLVENDLFRGQCRGSVGYPCKSLPLAPGRHHETCVTGYCNLGKDMCDDHPRKKQRKNEGRASGGVELMTGVLVFLGSLLSVRINC